MGASSILFVSILKYEKYANQNSTFQNFEVNQKFH